jgi:hypothetical protein
LSTLIAFSATSIIFAYAYIKDFTGGPWHHAFAYSVIPSAVVSGIELILTLPAYLTYKKPIDSNGQTSLWVNVAANAGAIIADILCYKGVWATFNYYY